MLSFINALPSGDNTSQIYVEEPHAGLYKCVATNDNGSAESKAWVAINEEPRLDFVEEHTEDTVELTEMGPPVFVQAINSYRITKDVKLAILAEVQSGGPVQFEW